MKNTNAKFKCVLFLLFFVAACGDDPEDTQLVFPQNFIFQEIQYVSDDCHEILQSDYISVDCNHAYWQTSFLEDIILDVVADNIYTTFLFCFESETELTIKDSTGLVLGTSNYIRENNVIKVGNDELIFSQSANGELLSLCASFYSYNYNDPNSQEQLYSNGIELINCVLYGNLNSELDSIKLRHNLMVGDSILLGHYEMVYDRY